MPFILILQLNFLTINKYLMKLVWQFSRRRRLHIDLEFGVVDMFSFFHSYLHLRSHTIIYQRPFLLPWKPYIHILQYTYGQHWLVSTDGDQHIGRGVQLTSFLFWHNQHAILHWTTQRGIKRDIVFFAYFFLDCHRAFYVHGGYER